MLSKMLAQEASGGAGRLLQRISGLYEATMMFSLLSPPDNTILSADRDDQIPLLPTALQMDHTETCIRAVASMGSKSSPISTAVPPVRSLSTHCWKIA